jgi:hypothetical protein
MEAERATLQQQALAEIATLDRLSVYALAEPGAVVPRALGRLAAAEREAVAASLALLLEGLHRLGQWTDAEP